MPCHSLDGSFRDCGLKGSVVVMALESIITESSIISLISSDLLSNVSDCLVVTSSLILLNLIGWFS